MNAARRIRRAALYVRVSTDRQTIENQEMQLRQVAERRVREVVEIYDDAGVSGAKGRKERPGLDPMLNDAIARRTSGRGDRDQDSKARLSKLPAHGLTHVSYDPVKLHCIRSVFTHHSADFLPQCARAPPVRF